MIQLTLNDYKYENKYLTNQKMEKLKRSNSISILLFILFIIGIIMYDGYSDGKEDKKNGEPMKKEKLDNSDKLN